MQLTIKKISDDPARPAFSIVADAAYKPESVLREARHQLGIVGMECGGILIEKIDLSRLAPHAWRLEITPRPHPSFVTTWIADAEGVRCA